MTNTNTDFIYLPPVSLKLVLEVGSYDIYLFK